MSNHADILFAKAYTYVARQNYENAVNAYREGLELDPNNATGWYNLGYCYALLNHHKEAIEAHQKAINLDSKLGKLGSVIINLYRLGRSYESLNRYDEAIKSYQNAAELDPENLTGRIRLAACYRKLGQEPERINQCEIVRELIAKKNEYRRACFEAVCGDVDESLRLLRIALEKKQQPLDWARKDQDMEFIRHDPRFLKLLDEFSKGEKPNQI